MIPNKFFNGLPAEMRGKLNESLVARKYKRGENIFEEGHKNVGVYYIKSGVIKRFIRDLEGRESIFEFCGKDELFGHRSIFTEEDHFDSATCLTDVEMYFLPKKIFIEFVKANDLTLQEFIVSLSEESIKYIRHTQLLAQAGLKQRSAFGFLYLQQKNTDNNDWTIEIGRDDLSNYLGTVKESAVRIMHDFKSAGYISSSGRRITLLNPTELKKIAKLIS